MAGTIAALDIGALYIKVLFGTDNGRSIAPIYSAHGGHVLDVLKRELSYRDGERNIKWIMTDNPESDYVDVFHDICTIDKVKALICGVKQEVPEVRNIIDIGGGSISLIELDDSGNFVNFQTNSLCAAGTGSFLDEQAMRLGINYNALKSFEFDTNPPSIASRCSVFAKSDLIHRQQEGFTKFQMWAGLCRSMCDTILNTLFKGKPITEITVLTGGVSQNPHISFWLKNKYGDLIQSISDSHLAVCKGMLIFAKSEYSDMASVDMQELLHTTPVLTRSSDRQKPLCLRKSNYPEPLQGKTYRDEQSNEIYISEKKLTDICEVFMGIDIGSTSTKIALMDRSRDIVLTIYRKTGGDPIDAIQKILDALRQCEKRMNISWKILGVATTGSGRNLIGKVIGADMIINEISAHVRGAMEIDPGIDTIFEIGGQDSKYMRTKNGTIFDSNMNYICAAGTGSFVEEQCRKLSIPLNDAGDMVLNIAPPFTSDRCTVFMEQDIMRLLQHGYRTEECLAAVMYSVVHNYLNKVVGNRYYSRKKVFFQGATARNKGLVAAFENVLDVEVVVSPFCHVMGCYGLTLTLLDRYREKPEASRFLGLDLSKKQINLTQDVCELCANSCTITHATIEGVTGSPSWGYLCGREPEDTKIKVTDYFKMYNKRQKMFRNTADKRQKEKPKRRVIGIPRVLSTYTYFPLWQSFFHELGFDVALSPETNDDIRKLTHGLVGADFCFPVKIAYGHVDYLMKQETIDFILLPFMISNRKNPGTSNNLYCPYLESLPAHICTSLEMHHIETDRVLKPIIDLRWKPGTQAIEIEKTMGVQLHLHRKQIEKAWKIALKVQEKSAEKFRFESRELLDRLEKEKKKAIVVIGRPYNTMDFGLNLNIPQKFAEKGFYVLPLDSLPISPTDVPDTFSGMFWDYGQKIIAALSYVKAHSNLYALYLTNFNCGPDSFLLSYAEEIMGDKPFLTLELDEHSADGGYITRLEAFTDVLNAATDQDNGAVDDLQSIIIPKPSLSLLELKNKTIWIPPMHPITGKLFAAAFKKYGYKAEALPGENRQAFEAGRREVRGSECLPTTCTIGIMLETMKRNNLVGKDHVFFMPTSEGPCRFGQYATLHRIILNRNGFEEMAILSPTSDNNYQGLEQKLRVDLFEAILLSDVLYKMTAKIRPYEKNRNEVNELLTYSVEKLEKVLPLGGSLESAMDSIILDFENIPVCTDMRKPLVGVVGEIYVRNNEFSNDSVVSAIEECGGEAWLTPISEWLLYTTYINSWMGKNYPSKLLTRVENFYKNRFMVKREHFWYEKTKSILYNRTEPSIEEVLEYAKQYLPLNFVGEAVLTIGRTIAFEKQGVSMVVNCSPFGCMPGTISQSIFQKIQNETNFPILTQFYDGEKGLNAKLAYYLNNISGKSDPVKKYALPLEFDIKRVKIVQS